MKDLKEIMMQMDNLSEQIAVSLNEGEVVENAEQALGETPAADIADPLQVVALPGCSAAATITRTVPFCCATSLPAIFSLNTVIPARILYDLSSLSVIVEPCTTTATVIGIPGGCSFTAYNVRVVGCIPFLANATVPPAAESGSSTCSIPAPTLGTTPAPFAICCSGTACVNNIVCRKCNEADALTTKASIEANLTCTGVNAAVSVARGAAGGGGTGSPTRCVVTFTGNFTLPNCP